MKIGILFKNRSETVVFSVCDQDRERVKRFLRGGVSKEFSFTDRIGNLVMIQTDQVQTAYETI